MQQMFSMQVKLNRQHGVYLTKERLWRKRGAGFDELRVRSERGLKIIYPSTIHHGFTSHEL